MKKIIVPVAVVVLLFAVISGALMLKKGKKSAPTEPKTAAVKKVQEKPGDEAFVKIELSNGVYQVLCCFSCAKLENQDPHAKANQTMAADFVKAGISRELQIPEGKKLEVRSGKYIIQPFRKGNFLVYMYEIAVSDCLVVKK